jgi:uncharacterized protein (DUF2235 family)
MDYKNIVICSDGTGNTTIKGRGTNVFKLFEAVDVIGHRTDPSLRRQLAFYDDGVGTQELRWIRAFAGATGYGLSRNVKRLYRELCRVYEPGDAIYLFGFSRGAFTVRTLAGLIGDCGLISPTDYPTERAFRQQARNAYKSYRRKYRALLTRLLPKHGMTADEFREKYARRDPDGRLHQPRIRLLGVWDTVDAVGLPFRLADFWNTVIWQFKFKTTSLGSIVEKGCHALAMNDDRASFEPVLWNEPPGGDPRIEQVWFAGAHSNVGGGYPQQGLSLVALDWMLGKAEAQGLRFNAVALESVRAQQSFADRLYDPRAGLGTFYRWKPRNVRQLCAGKGIDVPRIHLSVIERVVQAPEGYAPGNLPPRCAIVTTEHDPLISEPTVAAAIAEAHGGADAPSLIERQTSWVRLGFAAYLTFIAGTIGAALRALDLLAGEATTPFAAVAAAFSNVEVLPLRLVTAIGGDVTAASMLIAGLGLGYLLSDVSDRRTTQVYSAFWHRSRPVLREATRRTPAPDPALIGLAAGSERLQVLQ